MNKLSFSIMSGFKQLFFVVYLLMTCSILYAQGWEQTYEPSNSAYARSSGHLAPTPDAGFLVAGLEHTSGSTNDDVVVLKIDQEGVEQFRTVTPLPEYLGTELQGVELILLSDGNYAFLGYSENAAFGNFVLKLDVNGNVLFDLQIGVPPNEGGIRLKEMQNGDFLILSAHGNCNSPFQGQECWPHLVRMDTNGNILWSQTTFIDSEAFDIIETTAGNLVATGYKDASPDSLMVTVYNSNGILIENRLYDFPQLEGAAIVETGDGGFAIGANSVDYFNEFATTTSLIKINSNLDVEWIQSFVIEEDGGGVSGWPFIKRMVKTNDGGSALTGGYRESLGRGFLTKLDSNGELLWHRNYKEGNAFSTNIEELEYLSNEDAYVM